MRPRTVWLLTLPFLLLSETFGHTLVARTLDSGASRHHLALHPSGDYRQYAPAFVAAFLMLAAALLVHRALSFRTDGPRPLPAWKLAALPVPAFLLQEHVERLVQGARVGVLTSTDPEVLVGVALQLLCGLFALWLVRSLLRAADQLGCALARRSGRAARQEPTPTRRVVQASPLRLPVLASRHAGRAPPVLA